MNRYSLRKRTNRDADVEPIAKRSKRLPNSKSPKLTDVNYDCLEHIFLLLDFEDLFNIAHTNKELKPVVDRVFKRKFGGKRSTFFSIGIFRLNLQLEGNLSTNFYLNNPYGLLRCFGHLIPKHVIYSNSKMVSYVNEYCNASSTELAFHNMSKCDLDGLQRPFTNAEMVCFTNCRLDGNLEPLNILFPKVHSLTLDQCKIKSKHIKAHFPHMEQLKIIGSIPTKQSTVDLLKMNPQLRRLIWSNNDIATFLWTASQYLPRLEYLDIRYTKNDFADFGADVAHFKCLKGLKVNDHGRLMSKMPILSDCLQDLTWEFRNSKTNEVIKFLKKHPTIIKINLINCGFSKMSVGKRAIKKIAEVLPFLQEVDFIGFRVSSDETIQFVKNCKSLKKMCFNWKINNYIRLEEQLTEEWQISYTTNDAGVMTVIKRGC